MAERENTTNVVTKKEYTYIELAVARALGQLISIVFPAYVAAYVRQIKVGTGQIRIIMSKVLRDLLLVNKDKLMMIDQIALQKFNDIAKDTNQIHLLNEVAKLMMFKNRFGQKISNILDASYDSLREHVESAEKAGFRVNLELLREGLRLMGRVDPEGRRPRVDQLQTLGTSAAFAYTTLDLVNPYFGSCGKAAIKDRPAKEQVVRGGPPIAYYTTIAQALVEMQKILGGELKNFKPEFDSDDEEVKIKKELANLQEEDAPKRSNKKAKTKKLESDSDDEEVEAPKRSNKKAKLQR